ncbi:MAG: MG2 domain-containing protein [Bacteroidia bacterium]|nr:MG2 domain-containing protein [Bacteroidia bacterium]
MRKWLFYLLAAAGVGVGVWVWWQGDIILSKNFEVLGSKKGIPPGTQVLFLRTQNSPPPDHEPKLYIEPEGSVIAIRRAGPNEWMVLLGQPLAAGRSYILRGEGALRGRVRLKVEPLRVEVIPAVFVGPEGEPAFLVRANGTLSEPKLPLKDDKGGAPPTQWRPISAREGFILIKSKLSSLTVEPQQAAEYIVKERRIELGGPVPFELRESRVEEEGSRLRIRLRFSHWMEGKAQQAVHYITIAKNIPFTAEARGPDLFLYPIERPGTPFQILLEKGLPGQGEGLKQREELILNLPGITQMAWFQPYVHFVPPGTPLLLQADPTQEVDYTVWKILPQNIRLFFRQKVEYLNLWMNYPENLRQEQYEWWDYEGQWWKRVMGEEISPSFYGQEIRRGRLSVSFLRKVQRGGQTLYAFGEDLSPGIYLIELKGRSHLLRNWVVVSSYGLIARQWEKTVQVWALSYESQQPLSEVEVEVWAKDGRVLAKGRTNRRGEFLLSLPAGAEAEGIWSLWRGEMSYLPLWALRPGRWTFETGGIDPTAGMLVFLATPRTLYRPGEEIAVCGFIRTSQFTYPNIERVWGCLRAPSGRSLWEGWLPCDKDKSWRWSYRLTASAPTGTYSLEVYETAGGRLLRSLPIQVEAFRPARILFQVGSTLADKTLGIRIQAEFMYGTPAAFLSGEGRWRWKPLPPPPEKGKAFLWTPSIPDSAQKEGFFIESFKTNAMGEAHLKISLPQGWGYGEVKLSAQVQDEEGQPNFIATSVPCATQPYIAGMRFLPSYVRGGATLRVPVRVLRSSDFSLAQEAVPLRVEIIERRYEWLLIEQPWGGYKYEWRPLERLYYRSFVEVRGGEGDFSFTPQSGKVYEIRLWAPSQIFPVVQEVEAWGEEAESFLHTDPEGAVEILPQKSQYTVRETARLLIKTLFKSQCILTLEREKVLYSQWVQAEPGGAEVEVPLPPECVPGVYVHVVAFHEGDIPFRVSRGVIYLPVEDPSRLIQVHVEAPTQVMPGATFPVRVKTLRPFARIVLTGVDMGLLPLQREESTNPYDFFCRQKRAHTVQVREQLPYTAPWSREVVGGGEAEEADDEEVKATLERIEKGVSFFWSELRADKQGEVTVRVELPPYTGRLRWRAYVLEEGRFGMGEAQTLVSAPVVARLNAPRVMSEGDEVQLTLSLQNTTTAPLSGQWRIETEGEGLFFTARNGSYSLSAGQREQHIIHLRAIKPFGKSQVKLFINNYMVQQHEILLRPPEAPRREVRTYQLLPGETLTLPPLEAGFLPTGRRLRLIGGNLPILRFTRSVWELVRFPHGCGEQITSQTFANLVAAEWLRAIVGSHPDSLKLYVREGLAQLSALLTEEGGFSFWPGGSSDEWLSAYATLLLYSARRAGYQEADTLLKRALTYQRELFLGDTPASRTQALRALLLAQAVGSSLKSSFPSLEDINSIQDPVIRALWRGAFSLVGLPLPAPPQKLPQVLREYNGELSSEPRDLALFLYAEQFVSPAHRSPLVREAQAQLYQYAEGHWLSTQEMAWIILAWSSNAGANSPLIEVQGEGKSPIYHSEGMWGEDIKTTALTLRNKGRVPAFIAIVVEGIPLRSPPPSHSPQIRLSTALKAEKGDSSQIGSFLKWQIAIEVGEKIPLPLPNVALTLPLPAGWIVENARLLPENRAIQSSGLELAYVDFRDDRLHLYITLTQPSALIEVPVQVLLRGRYALPSISLQVMYEPSLEAATQSRILKVGANL